MAVLSKCAFGSGTSPSSRPLPEPSMNEFASPRLASRLTATSSAGMGSVRRPTSQSSLFFKPQGSDEQGVYFRTPATNALSHTMHCVCTACALREDCVLPARCPSASFPLEGWIPFKDGILLFIARQPLPCEEEVYINHIFEFHFMSVSNTFCY